MAPRSLRWQLTFAFTGVAALVVLAAAAGMSVLIARAVWAPLDAALEEEGETLATLSSVERAEDLASAVAGIASEPNLGPGKFVRVAAADGRILAESGTIPAAVAALALPAVLQATVGDATGAYRVVWYPAPKGGWNEVGVRVNRHVRTLHLANLAIGATAVLLLASLAVLAWAITSRATAELARLAAELETVEAGSLDRRLAPRRTVEVDRLAAVLNRLLARLESAVGHLRRFTADAAHELRTPVAALRAHLEVALARARTPEAYQDGLIDALEQTERLGRLAADLLTLSAVEAGTTGGETRDEIVRLDRLAREVAEFLEPVAQEQGRPFLCEAEHAVAVRGAPELLKRLVLNLVDNAFRHTPVAAPVHLCVREEDGLARIEVRDGGPGIVAADVPGVFERFRRGRSATAGTGLGLALCREIAARHRGQIALDSAPGSGTTVTVTLALAGAGAPS